MTPTHFSRTALSGLLTFSLAAFGAPSVRAAAAEDAALKIVVLEGEDGVNIIDKKTAVKSVVEVRDKNNLPVAGAVVIFTVVAVAAGGRGGDAAFASGQKAVTVVTDASGRATATGLQPLAKGEVQLKVQAFNKGQTASTTISQSNYATEAEAAEAAKAKAEAKEKSEQQTEQKSETNQGNQASQASSSGASAASAPAIAAAATPVVATSSTTTSAAAGGGAAAAGGGGMSALAVTGLVAGGIAGAAGAYYVAEEARTPDCTAEGNQMIAEVESQNQICFSGSEAQCYAATQRAFNAIDRLCACAGPSPTAELRDLWQQLRADWPREFTFPSSCR